MKLLSNFTDARQSREWAAFLENIGWEIITIEGIYIYIRTLPVIKRTVLKIQHPHGPLPFLKIETLAKKRHALFTVIEPHAVGYTKDAYMEHGYRVSKLRYAHSATILIDLKKSKSELWNSFSENTRRNVKKAQKNLTVSLYPLQKEKGERLHQLFYSLYTKLGKEKSFYVPSYEETKAKMDAFKKTSYILAAHEKGSEDPIAMLWVGLVDDTLIYFHPANTKRGYELLANYLLIWEALLLGKKLGLRVFDFETAYDSRYPRENTGWKGYSEFKKKFGGEFFEYPPSFIKFYNPVFQSIYTVATLFSK